MSVGIWCICVVYLITGAFHALNEGLLRFFDFHMLRVEN